MRTHMHVYRQSASLDECIGNSVVVSRMHFKRRGDILWNFWNKYFMPVDISTHATLMKKASIYSGDWFKKFRPAFSGSVIKTSEGSQFLNCIMGLRWLLSTSQGCFKDLWDQFHKALWASWKEVLRKIKHHYSFCSGTGPLRGSLRKSK